MEGKEQFRISVKINGIKKRCRKSDRHTFKLGYCDLEDLKLKDFELKAYDIIDTKMRITDYATLDYVLVKVNGDMETWAPFDDRTKALSKSYFLIKETTEVPA